jgi:hypothetical protein
MCGWKKVRPGINLCHKTEDPLPVEGYPVGIIPIQFSVKPFCGLTSDKSHRSEGVLCVDHYRFRRLSVPTQIGNSSSCRTISKGFGGVRFHLTQGILSGFPTPLVHAPLVKGSNAGEGCYMRWVVFLGAVLVLSLVVGGWSLWRRTRFC